MSRQARPQPLWTDEPGDPVPAGHMAKPARLERPDGLRPRRLLESRASGGSLLSIRIPVTEDNRGLLRSLRSEEMHAWQTLEA